MAKRKNDRSLDNVFVGFLKRRKYRRTLELFGSEFGNNIAVNSKVFDEFENFLKEKIKHEPKKEYADDDLGFEINFEAFQPTQKVILNFSKFEISIEFSIQQQSVFIPTRKNPRRL